MDTTTPYITDRERLIARVDAGAVRGQDSPIDTGSRISEVYKAFAMLEEGLEVLHERLRLVLRELPQQSVAVEYETKRPAAESPLASELDQILLRLLSASDRVNALTCRVDL